MNKVSKLGKKDIFARTEVLPSASETAQAAPVLDLPPPPPAEIAPAKGTPSAMGRPATHEEWTKVTVVLFNRQIVFLDRVANDIRAKTGAAIRRAEILRALVDALESEGIDLSAAKSEADLKALLSARLRA